MVRVRGIAAVIVVLDLLCRAAISNDVSIGRCRTVTIIGAQTQREHEEGTLPMVSINGQIYLADVRHASAASGRYPTPDDYMNFGMSKWDCRTYRDQSTDLRTKAYSKQSGPETPWVSDSGKYMGYGLVGPDIVVRLVDEKEEGTSHEWIEELIAQKTSSSPEVRLRVAKGIHKGWYLSFAAPETIDKRTTWKDSVNPMRSGEIPPHIRFPATLVKDADKMSLLRTIGYFPDGK